MKNSLLILAGAAALSLASCSQEKTTDTTVAAGDGTMTTTTTTTTTAMSEADMEARAQRIADRMVADMKITDEATKNKIRTVYVNRYRQMGDMQTKYASDTTGMAAAMRESMATTDAEFKTIFADPTQYQTYETSRMTYYNMADEDAAMSSGSTTSDMSTSTDTDMSDEGSKVKVKADGDIKMKDANGNVTKMDGDDGTIKMKDESGNKTKIK